MVFCTNKLRTFEKDMTSEAIVQSLLSAPLPLDTHIGTLYFTMNGCNFVLPMVYMFTQCSTS